MSKAHNESGWGALLKCETKLRYGFETKPIFQEHRTKGLILHIKLYNIKHQLKCWYYIHKVP